MALFRFLSSISLMLSSSLANAAEITSEENPDGTMTIRIDGEIKAGDDEKFRRLSLRYPNATVRLESDGGALIPALEIGRTIRIAGYDTLVATEATCASACALVWLAGKKRYLSGKVGFHAAYRTNDGRIEESGTANALIGNYMTLLGLPAKAIVFATAAPPDKVLWLMPDNRELTGIDFELPIALPPIEIKPLTKAGQNSQSPVRVTPSPAPAKSSSDIRVLEQEFFLTEADGQELYIVTFLLRGLKLRYPIPIDGDVNAKLLEFFDDEIARKDGWINIYLDGDVNKKEMVSYDIHHPTISRQGKMAEVWLREDHEFNRRVPHRTEISLVRFFCGQRLVSFLETTKYDPDEKIISSEQFRPENSRIYPDSVIEPVYEAICP